MHEFAELSELMRLRRMFSGLGDVREEATISHKGLSFPILSFHFGVKDEKAPTLVFVAGVHGLEKIGTQILTSFLHSWTQLLKWDKSLQSTLKSSRVVFYPLVNPVGMYLNTRSNGNGVDLMRNGRVEAKGKTLPLIAGHRISPRLPWYRGKNGIEPEALALRTFIRDLCFRGASSIVLDIHSGFGLKDSLWFPYAGSAEYFPEAARMLAIKQIFDKSFPHHTYNIEPQHLSYTTHGDLWDDLFLEFEASRSFHHHSGHFLPLCLEMGSWTWIKKNPRQMFSSLGLFNPILPHRVKRAERRHFLLFSFLLKLITSPEAWLELPAGRMRILTHHANQMWYKDR